MARRDELEFALSADAVEARQTMQRMQTEKSTFKNLYKAAARLKAWQEGSLDTYRQITEENYRAQGLDELTAKQRATEDIADRADRYDKIVNDLKLEIHNQVKEGAVGLTFNDIIADDQQQQQIKKGELFQLNAQQKMRKLAYEYRDDPDKLARLFVHGLSQEPERDARLGSDITADWHELDTPTGKLPEPPMHPIWKAADAPGWAGSMTSGTAENLKRQLQLKTLREAKDYPAPSEAWAEVPLSTPEQRTSAGETAQNFVSKKLGKLGIEGPPPEDRTLSSIMSGAGAAVGATMLAGAGPLGLALAPFGAAGAILSPMLSENLHKAPEAARAAVESLPDRLSLGEEDVPGASLVLGTKRLVEQGVQEANRHLNIFPDKQQEPTPSPQRWGGVAVEDAARKLYHNPRMIWDAVSEAFSQSLSPNERGDVVANNVIFGIKRYRDLAREKSGGDKELESRLFQRYLQTDNQVSWSPAIQQLAGEVALDPLMWFGSGVLPAAGRKLVGKVATTEAGRVFLRSLQDLRGSSQVRKMLELFSYMPASHEVDTLEAGGASLGEVIRTIPGFAKNEADTLLKPLEEVIGKMEAMKFSPEEWKLVQEWRERGFTTQDAPELWGEQALMLLDEAAEAHQEIRQAYGLGQKYNEKTGLLMGSFERRDYYPERLFEKGPGEDATPLFRELPVQTPTRGTFSSAKRHHAKKDAVPIADLAQQWRAEIKQVRGALVKDIQVHNITRALEEVPIQDALGAVEHLKVPQNATVDPDVMSEFLASTVEPRLRKLRDETGVRWSGVDVYDDINKIAFELRNEESPGNVYRRIVGQGADPRAGIAGQFSVGSHLTLMPEGVAESLKPLLHVGVDRVEGMQAVADLADTVLFPARFGNRVWRGTHTVLNFPFLMLNMGGAAVISMTNLGAKALDPKMAGKALGAAMISGELYSDELRGIRWATRGGVEHTLGEAVDKMRHWEGLRMQDSRLGLGQEFGGLRLTTEAATDAYGRLKGKAQGIADTMWSGLEAVENVAYRFGGPGAEGSIRSKVGLNKISPQNLNGITDDFQKIWFFMNTVEDMNNPRSMARAMDMTAKFAGSYSRLGSFEKRWFKDVAGFYNWNRFIVPWFLRHTAHNPQRIAAFERFRQYLTTESYDNAPVGREGYAPWARAYGIPARMSAQPEAIQQGQPLGITNHEFAITMMESPWRMGADPIAQILGMDNRTPTDLLGYAWRTVLENAVLQRDLRTGDPLPGWTHTGSPEEWTKDWQTIRDGQGKPRLALPRAMFGLVERPTRDWQAVMNVYMDAGQEDRAVDLAMRYKAGRAIGSIDHALSFLGGQYGYIGQQLGLMEPDALQFQAPTMGGLFQTGLSPGSIYLQDALKGNVTSAYNAQESKPR